MKKLILSAVFLVSPLFLGTQSSFAESVAVAGGSVFILDSSTPTAPQIIVKNIDATTNTCSPIPVTLIGGTKATDIVIKDGTAVVTTETTAAPPVATDVVFVDVSSCLPAQTNPANCAATVDLNEGSLVIPCVQIGEETYEVHMERRGSSSNWEVSFAGPNPLFTHNGDDDEDDDDDDDDDSESKKVSN